MRHSCNPTIAHNRTCDSARKHQAGDNGDGCARHTLLFDNSLPSDPHATPIAASVSPYATKYSQMRRRPYDNKCPSYSRELGSLESENIGRIGNRLCDATPNAAAGNDLSVKNADGATCPVTAATAVSASTSARDYISSQRCMDPKRSRPTIVKYIQWSNGIVDVFFSDDTLLSFTDGMRRFVAFSNSSNSTSQKMSECERDTRTGVQGSCATSDIPERTEGDYVFTAWSASAHVEKVRDALQLFNGHNARPYVHPRLLPSSPATLTVGQRDTLRCPGNSRERTLTQSSPNCPCSPSNGCFSSEEKVSYASENISAAHGRIREWRHEVSIHTLLLKKDCSLLRVREVRADVRRRATTREDLECGKGFGNIARNDSSDGDDGSGIETVRVGEEVSLRCAVGETTLCLHHTLDFFTVEWPVPLSLGDGDTTGGTTVGHAPHRSALSRATIDRARRMAAGDDSATKHINNNKGNLTAGALHYTRVTQTFPLRCFPREWCPMLELLLLLYAQELSSRGANVKNNNGGDGDSVVMEEKRSTSSEPPRFFSFPLPTALTVTPDSDKTCEQWEEKGKHSTSHSTLFSGRFSPMTPALAQSLLRHVERAHSSETYRQLYAEAASVASSPSRPYVSLMVDRPVSRLCHLLDDTSARAANNNAAAVYWCLNSGKASDADGDNDACSTVLLMTQEVRRMLAVLSADRSSGGDAETEQEAKEKMKVSREADDHAVNSGSDIDNGRSTVSSENNPMVSTTSGTPGSVLAYVCEDASALLCAPHSAVHNSYAAAHRSMDCRVHYYHLRSTDSLAAGGGDSAGNTTSEERIKSGGGGGSQGSRHTPRTGTFVSSASSSCSLTAVPSFSLPPTVGSLCFVRRRGGSENDGCNRSSSSSGTVCDVLLAQTSSIARVYSIAADAGKCQGADSKREQHIRPQESEALCFYLSQHTGNTSTDPHTHTHTRKQSPARGRYLSSVVRTCLQLSQLSLLHLQHHGSSAAVDPCSVGSHLHRDHHNQQEQREEQSGNTPGRRAVNANTSASGLTSDLHLSPSDTPCSQVNPSLYASSLALRLIEPRHRRQRPSLMHSPRSIHHYATPTGNSSNSALLPPSIHFDTPQSPYAPEMMCEGKNILNSISSSSGDSPASAGQWSTLLLSSIKKNYHDPYEEQRMDGTNKSIMSSSSSSIYHNNNNNKNNNNNNIVLSYSGQSAGGARDTSLTTDETASTVGGGTPTHHGRGETENASNGAAAATVVERVLFGEGSDSTLAAAQQQDNFSGENNSSSADAAAVVTAGSINGFASFVDGAELRRRNRALIMEII